MNRQTEKKLYEQPELAVVEIDLTDIITTSCPCHIVIGECPNADTYGEGGNT